MYIRQTYNIEALIGSLLQAPTWIIQEYYRGSAVRGYSRIVIVFYVFVQGDDNDAPANRLWEQVISIWGEQRAREMEREGGWVRGREEGREGERRGDESAADAQGAPSLSDLQQHSKIMDNLPQDG